MMLKQAEQRLNEFLTPIVSTFGFKRLSGLYYTKPLNQSIAKIAFGCRFDARGFIAVTCGVGVSFESLDRWLKDDPAELRSTLGTPIHVLRDDRAFTEWRFNTPEQLEALRDPILQDLRKHALPFIEKYSHLDEVIKTVSSADPKDWFNWNVNSRVNFLAVVRVVRGDKTGALRLLDDAIIERVGARRNGRREIEELRRRIADAG